MDCIRISFLRDGKEVKWFMNYDLEIIRDLISLIDSQPYDENLSNFRETLSDLLIDVNS